MPDVTTVGARNAVEDCWALVRRIGKAYAAGDVPALEDALRTIKLAHDPDFESEVRAALEYLG